MFYYARVSTAFKNDLYYLCIIDRYFFRVPIRKLSDGSLSWVVTGESSEKPEYIIRWSAAEQSKLPGAFLPLAAAKEQLTEFLLKTVSVSKPGSVQSQQLVVSLIFFNVSSIRLIFINMSPNDICVWRDTTPSGFQRRVYIMYHSTISWEHVENISRHYFKNSKATENMLGAGICVQVPE